MQIDPAYFLTCGPIAFDTETVGPNVVGGKGPRPLDHKIIGFSVSDGLKSEYYAVRHTQDNDMGVDEARKYLCRLLGQNRPVWAHNWKYDLQVLRNDRVPVKSEIRDTMVLAWLCGKAVPVGKSKHGLKALVKHWLHYEMKTFEETIGDVTADALDPFYMAPYARDDVKWCLKLAEFLEPIATKLKVWEEFLGLEMPTLRVISHMERWGIKVDRDYLGRLSQELGEEMDSLKDTWGVLTGTAIGSSQQVSEHMFGKKIWDPVKKGKSGRWSTDKETIERQLATLPEGSVGRQLAQLKLRYSMISKIQSTYTHKLVEQADQYEDGRLRTSFNQVGTETGRFSSTRPNLQNQPRPNDELPSIRKAFIAEPGWKLVVADYDQLEICILAHYSQDPKLLAVVLDGQSMHDITASSLDIPRPTAKTVNFAMNYGCGPKKLAMQLDVPLQRVRKKNGKFVWRAPKQTRNMVEQWRDTYEGVKKYQERAASYARQHGFVRTLSGRVRHIPEVYGLRSFAPYQITRALADYGLDTKDEAEETLYKLSKFKGERIAGNTPIQGSAADIVKMGMVRLYRRWKERGWLGSKARILLQIHDEVVCELQEDCVEQGAKDVQWALEGAWKLRVPLTAAPGVGDTWEEAK